MRSRPRGRRTGSWCAGACPEATPRPAVTRRFGALEPAAVLGHANRILPRARTELLHDRRQVVAGRAAGEVKVAGDLRDRAALAGASEHLALAGGERVGAGSER